MPRVAMAEEVEVQLTVLQEVESGRELQEPAVGLLPEAGVQGRGFEVEVVVGSALSVTV